MKRYSDVSIDISAEECVQSKRYHGLTVIELGLRGHVLLFLFLLVLRPQYLFREHVVRPAHSIR
jgi:hypothetical protein